MRNNNRKMMYRAYDPIDDLDILPDSSAIMPDGSVILPDGSIILPDGSIILPDDSVVLPEDPSIPQEVPIIDCTISQSNFTIMAPENHNLNMNRVLFGTGNVKKQMKVKKSFGQSAQNIRNYSDYYSNNNFTSNFRPLQQ